MTRITISVGPVGACATLACLIAYGAGMFLAARAVYLEEPAASAAPQQAVRGPAQSFARDAGALVDWKFFRGAAPGAGGAAPQPAGDVADIVRRADEAYAAREYAAAAAGYERAMALAPGNTDVQNNLGLVLHYAGDDARALAHLEAATRRDPDHQRSWLTLGFVRMSTGDRQGAVEALSRARDLDPGNAIAEKSAAYLQSLR